MSFRKLSNTPGFEPDLRPACLAPAHTPPLSALNAGTWEWTCPVCGDRTVFSVVDVQGSTL